LIFVVGESCVSDGMAFLLNVCRKRDKGMNQKEVMRENLIEEINSYYDHYVYMADVMAVCEHIGHFANFESNKLEIAPNFFKIVHAATIDCFNITFARLYDNSRQTKSIANLISKCKKIYHYLIMHKK